MAEQNPSVPQTLQQDLEEVKGLVDSKLSEMQVQLRELQVTEANNPLDRLQLENLQQTKKLLIQTLTEELKPHTPDFNRTGELLYKTVLEKLEMQLKETARMIKSEKRELNKLNKKIQSLQEKCELYENISLKRLEYGEMKLAENCDEIEKELETEFQKHWKALKYVVNTIYPRKPDMWRIIQSLFQSYGENPSDYIELSAEDMMKVCRFFNAGIITRHPYDPMKVRLC